MVSLDSVFFHFSISCKIAVHARNAPYASESNSISSQETLPSVLSSASSLEQSPSFSLDPPPPTFTDRVLSFIAARNDDPFAQWLRKHADDPISAAKRWVTEHLQFGVCMFDPAGLKNRYSRLVNWESEGGLWINYWTTTIPVPQRHSRAESSEAVETPKVDRIDNDEALVANGIIPPPDMNTSTPSTLNVASSMGSSPSLPLHTVPTKAEAKAYAKGSQKEEKAREKEVKQQEKQLKREERARAKAAKQENNRKAKPERHFVVLPNGLGGVLGGFERWENVAIAGVEDEVNAHTGLFIPHHNLDYEALVTRVSTRILGWCEKLPKT